MKRPCLLLAPCLFALAASSVSAPAHALGPVDLEVALLGGYGSNPSGLAPNPIGPQLGGRAGVSFFGFYGGAKFLYNLGGTTQGCLQTPEGSCMSGAQTFRSFQVGVELGYSFKLPRLPLTIRPVLGLGNYTYTPSGEGLGCDPASPCSSSGLLYVEPGVTVLLGLGRHFFVGADVNAFLLPSVPDDSGTTFDRAVTAHAQVGAKF